MERTSSQWIPVALAAAMAISISGCTIFGVGFGTICAVIILIIDVIAIIDVVRRGKSFISGYLWSLAIFVLPIIGAFIWWAVHSDTDESEESESDAPAAIAETGVNSTEVEAAPISLPSRTPNVRR